MTSLFRGIVNADGRVRANLSKAGPGSTIKGGIALGANNVVHMSTTSLVESRVMGVPISNDGTVCVETDVGASSVYLPGGLREGDTGRLYCTETDAPEVIHQGVGVRNGGRLCLSLEPLATFIANLHNNVASTTGPGTFARGSDGLYLGADGVWRVAPDDVPRFENDRLLMEPAITNKCENWNVQPDVAQSGVTLGGSGTLIRAQDVPEEILAIGNGFSWDLDAAAGSSAVVFTGQAGNTNTHTASAWVKKLFGASDPFIRIGASGDIVEFSNVDWQRITLTTNPTVAADEMRMQCPLGVRARIVFNQLEESPVVTSPIITQGAAANREADTLEWVEDGWFNQPENTFLFTLQPRFASSIYEVADFQSMVTLSEQATRYHFLQKPSTTVQQRASDGTNVAVNTIVFSANDVIKFCVKASLAATRIEVGHSINGAAWDWAAQTAYAGSFPNTGQLSLLYSLVKGAWSASDLIAYNSYLSRQEVEDGY